MKIKIFFVTYQEIETLNETLESFFSTCDSSMFSEICIINNHSNFKLSEKFDKIINVLHNECRPDFSTGHLARNWNQALLHGFKSLSNPDCDVLIHCQNDVKFYDGWLDKVLDLHKTYDFVAIGAGDCFCSYKPDHVKKVGIWDERYCGIGFQEADYFLRSVYHNFNKTSITDIGHNRMHNNVVPRMSNPRGFDAYEKAGICHMSNWEQGQNIFHKESANNGHGPSLKVFENKFNYCSPSNININTNMNLYSGKLKTAMLYPYFEKDIYELKEKKYVL